MSSDTIFALASGAGRAAIAVIRLSGPLVSPLVEAVAGLTPTPRFAHYVRLRDPRSGETIDRGLLLFFLSRARRPAKITPSCRFMAVAP